MNTTKTLADELRAFEALDQEVCAYCLERGNLLADGTSRVSCADCGGGGLISATEMLLRKAAAALEAKDEALRSIDLLGWEPRGGWKGVAERAQRIARAALALGQEGGA